MFRYKSIIHRWPDRPTQTTAGFTLLEVLIALFIFTIVSLLLMSALRSVIHAEEGTEKSAARLRMAQIAFLLLSRDVEQAVNRPVRNASGLEERAFVGMPQEMTLTHAGQPYLRTRYVYQDKVLWRETWPVLDRTPKTPSHTRALLQPVEYFRLDYLDHTRHFHNEWPSGGQAKTKEPLPMAVRLTVTMTGWGTISQLYVLP